jgi:hypothetical protein
MPSDSTPLMLLVATKLRDSIMEELDIFTYSKVNFISTNLRWTEVVGA